MDSDKNNPEGNNKIDSTTDTNKQSKVGCIFLLIFIVIIIIFFISIFNTCRSCNSSTSSSYSSSNSYSSSYNSSVRIGDTITIPYLILGTTESNWDQLITYASRKQNAEMLTMAAQGRAFIVDDNTKAEVIDQSSIYKIKVKILSGQHTGKVGWLSSELIEN